LAENLEEQIKSLFKPIFISKSTRYLRHNVNFLLDFFGVSKNFRNDIFYPIFFLRKNAFFDTKKYIWRKNVDDPIRPNAGYAT